MSVEHWFDNLSRPHTRRTTLKTAAVVGAALILPGMRTPRASATPKEPCFEPCNDAAVKRWNVKKDICGQVFPLAASTFAAFGAAGPFVLLTILSDMNDFRCMSSAEVDWHRDTIACTGSECGNAGKYPGGVPAGPKETCDPATQKACGDTCCRNFVDCCLSKKTGKYVCFAAGHNCEGA